MRTFLLSFLSCIYLGPALAQCAPGATIRVGTNCSCNTCTDVTVMSIESYTETGLNDEWIPSWNTESLKAGSVAYRSYGAYYIDHPYNGTYDLANTTCKQVWSASSSTSCVAAAAATAGQVLTTGTAGPIARSEYAAETNDFGCGDGFTGCSTCSTPWPCISDAVCAGKASAGHWRGMCQWGSQRWAQSGQTYEWILNHYYNPGNVYLCMGSPGCSPATNNDYCFGPPAPTVLSPNPGCSPINGTTCGATSSFTSGSSCSNSHVNSNVRDVWYSFTATGGSLTISVQSGTNFDAVAELYTGPCGTMLLSCMNATNTGGSEHIALTGATIGATYYVRVYDYFENSNATLPDGTNFTICLQGPVGVNEIANEHQLSVYPNPTTGIFTINSHAYITNIDITNTLGQKVNFDLQNTSKKQFTADLGDNPAGIYFVQASTTSETIRVKLVKVN